MFINKTQSYRAEQVLTEAVVREMTSRSPYKVVMNDDGSSDAVLRGTVVTTNVYPLTYDSQSGRQSSARTMRDSRRGSTQAATIRKLPTAAGQSG